MRWILITAALCPLNAGGAEEPFVEINGVRIERGMPEAEVRAAFPKIYCAESHDPSPSPVIACGVGDGVTPEADGEVHFQNGSVLRASRNWFVPEDASPHDTMLMLNEILARFAGEFTTCAKVETDSQRGSTGTLIVLPERYFYIWTQDFRGRRVIIREGLRVNPVPARYRVHGAKMLGTDWCAFVTSDDDGLAAQQ